MFATIKCLYSILEYKSFIFSFNVVVVDDKSLATFDTSVFNAFVELFIASATG
ncbi:MAG: hypothetical protein ACRC42_03130 [Mycoplasma sp.]